MQKRKDKKWEKQHVEMVDGKTMLIVGFGDIGAACGKIAKYGFGVKVVGIKRRPEAISEEDKNCADIIVGNDKISEWLPKADYVVSVLPKLEDTINFFNKDLFSQMKPTSVFMNVGRGITVNENDLIQALKENKIAGAVLDVYQVEPLPKESELWTLPNVLMTPHCAD